MKRIVLLGSTGSIGTQTLDVVRRHPDRLQVVGLAAGRNREALQAQAEEFGVRKTALFEDPGGIEAIADLASMPEADLVVVAVAGVIGLVPTLAAIEAGKAIALASKEVLVAAGELVMSKVRERGVTLTPIDSEHSAVFQCLQGYRSEQVRRLVLTASGGPFRGKKRAELEAMTAREALNHPTWNMGGKITIDSATLMNKGLETIEAKWLFGLEMDQVDVLIHPQSVIHSMVEFRDGSVLGQLGWPDMRLPIAYALLYPERLENGMRPWNPLETGALTFEPVDHDTFPSIGIARRSEAIGRTAPCAMNAANEEAANAFLRGEVGFLQIAEVVERVLADHRPCEPNLENLLQTDATSRHAARKYMRELSASHLA